MRLEGVLSSVGTLTGTLQEVGSLSAVLTGGVNVIEPLPYYTGAYTITPSAEAQTLNTEQMSMAYDVVINPIPQNYGLITWNGHTLTVS